MATGSGFKIPPIWTEEQTFSSWKNKVLLWSTVTSLEKTKQGVVVALSLSGRREEVALEIAQAEL